VSVVQGTLEESDLGTWVADLETDPSDSTSGPFSFGGVSWTGLTRASRVEGGVSIRRVVGGTSSYSQQVGSQSFRDTSLSTILRSLLLNTDFEGSAVDLDVPIYCVLGGPLGLVIGKLASTLGVGHYVTREGSIRVEDRVGSEVSEKVDRVGTDLEGSVLLNCSSCSLVKPGDTYEGQVIRHVRWRLAPNSLTADVSFKRLARFPDPSLGYELTYASKIVRQHTDDNGSLPLVDVLVNGQLGITKVPIMTGGPLKIKMEENDLCRVGFENGDPRRPYVLAVVQKGSKRVAREGDTISLGRLAFVPGSGTDTLTWTPPPTEANPVPVPVVISAGGVDIYGVIDQGSDELKTT
jgi:hypothetical protein